MSRAERKRDHIQFALSASGNGHSMFDDIRFIHQALPDIGVDDIRLSPKTGDLKLGSPVFINAMTGGGGEETERLNGIFARAARETGMAMAVGSQMAAIKDPSEIPSYKIVRKENPAGILFANLGSEATVENARQAVEMIEANALQIHLNVIQELTMPEGDRDFKGALDRIHSISEKLAVPVIVKETGFGLSREAVQKLNETAVSAVDVSGYGGTNFAVIENERRRRKLSFFNDWGIPTPVSIIETAASSTKTVLASGGIRHAGDVVKSLLLGAQACGLSGSFLKTAALQGEKQLIADIQMLHEDISMMMTALGAATITQLQSCPVLLTGELYHNLTLRGYDCSSYACRQRNNT